MALQVSMNESQFIVDVGFAQNYRAPLKFILNHIQPDVTGHYKIVQASTPPQSNTALKRLAEPAKKAALEASGPASSNNSATSSTTVNSNNTNQHLINPNHNSIYSSSTSFTSSTSSSSSSSSSFSSNNNQMSHLHHHNQHHNTFVIQKCLNEDLSQWMPLYEFNIIPKRIEEFKLMVEYVKSKEHLRFHERYFFVRVYLFCSFSLVRIKIYYLKNENTFFMFVVV